MTDNKFSIRRTLPPWLSGLWGQITIFFALYVLVYLGWVAFHWGGEENVTLIGDLAYLPVDLIAVIAAWRVFTQKDLDLRIRRMWLLLGLAFFSYLMGDLIWAYFENVLQVQPFPSAADVFYLLFAPLAAIGLFSMPGAPLNRQERWRYFFDMLIIMTTSGVLMWYFIIQPTAESNAGDLLTQVIAVAYPVTDFIVISSIVGALLRQPDRDTRSVLWFLFVGMIFFVGADIVYAYTGLAGTYATGSWVDAGWILAQFIFMIAALRQKYQALADLQNSRLANLQDNFVRMLPTIAVAAGAFVAIGTVVTNYQTQAGWLMSGALVILLLFVVRQFINIQTSSFRNRLAWSFVLLAGLTMVVILIGSFIQFRQTSRSAYQQRLLDIVTLTAMQQDGDAFLTISSENDAEFQRVRARNLAIKRISPDFAFVYTMRYDDQGIYFVVDAGEPNDPGLAAFGERYEDPSETLAASYRTLTTPIVDEDIYTDAYGSFLSAYAPIWTDGGQIAGIIGVDIAADKVLASEWDFLVTNIGLFALTLPLIALLGWFLGNSLASPIQKLARATAQISSGEFNYQPVATTVPEIQLLNQAFSAMTEQLKGLIESLEARVLERTKALATSAEVSRRLSTISNQKQLVTEVVEQVKSAFGYYHAHIYLVSEANGDLVMAGGTGDAGKSMLARRHHIPKGRGLVGRAAESGKPVLVTDTTKDSVWLHNPLLPETKSEAAIPISIGSEVLGVLDVQHNITDGLKQQDVDLLQSISNQIAIALQNIRSAEIVAKRAAELQTVATISTATSTIRNTQDMLATVVHLTQREFDLYHAHVFILNEATRELQIAACGWKEGDEHEGSLETVSIPLDKEQSLVARAARTKQAVIANNVFLEPGWLPNPMLPDTASELAVPLVIGDKVLGVLDVQSDRVNAFTDEDANIQTTLASQVATALQNARSFTQAQNMAEREAMLNIINQKIQSATSVEAVLQIAARELGHALGAPMTVAQLSMKDRSS